MVKLLSWSCSVARGAEVVFELMDFEIEDLEAEGTWGTDGEEAGDREGR